jgi:hypothetical protein
MEMEGEPEIFIVTMPTRNVLQFAANGLSGLSFTYRRVR